MTATSSPTCTLRSRLAFVRVLGITQRRDLESSTLHGIIQDLQHGSNASQRDSTIFPNDQTPQYPPVVRASHRFCETNGGRYIKANATLAHTNFRELETKAKNDAYFVEHFERKEGGGYG